MSPLDILTSEDAETARRYVGRRKPDVVIAPDGEPYLYRWYVVRRERGANLYFHMQIADDPARPLHDHPWQNMSVILAGGYREIIQHNPPFGAIQEVTRKPGDVIFRPAQYAHRLLMPEGVPYTLTQFSTGPKIREWGFWYPEGWVSWQDCTETSADGVSIHKRRQR